MKKVLFFSMFVLLTILVSAEDLNCQYPEIIYYTENVRVLVYEGTNEYGAEDLTFSGFTEGEIVTFVIKNPNDFRVRVVHN